MIPKTPSPRGTTGASDFWYGRGVVPYPVIRIGRPVASAVNGIKTEIGEVTGNNVTHTFNSSSGDVPQISPESQIRISLPILCLIVYVGAFWYDYNNPEANTAGAKVFHSVYVDGHEIRPTRGLFHEMADGKGFESVTDDELFFAQIHEFQLIEAGDHLVDHRMWVENKASLVSPLEIKYSDRMWSTYGFITERF